MHCEHMATKGSFPPFWGWLEMAKHENRPHMNRTLDFWEADVSCWLCRSSSPLPYFPSSPPSPPLSPLPCFPSPPPIHLMTFYKCASPSRWEVCIWKWECQNRIPTNQLSSVASSMGWMWQLCSQSLKPQHRPPLSLPFPQSVKPRRTSLPYNLHPSKFNVRTSFVACLLTWRAGLMHCSCFSTLYAPLATRMPSVCHLYFMNGCLEL